MMQNKTHHSLHRLQNTLCQELKHLELFQSSHKKELSAASLKTPIKNVSLIRLSESIYAKNGKPAQLYGGSIRGKTGGEGKKRLHTPCQQKLKDAKQNKLKKKGVINVKSKGYLWEMSNASTKCNDSKVESRSLNVSELLKKNKQYQQIISNQRVLIQKMEKIIDESYSLNNQ